MKSKSDHEVENSLMEYRKADFFLFNGSYEFYSFVVVLRCSLGIMVPTAYILFIFHLERNNTVANRTLCSYHRVEKSFYVFSLKL